MSLLSHDPSEVILICYIRYYHQCWKQFVVV